MTVTGEPLGVETGSWVESNAGGMPQRIEQFIQTQPNTLGIYEGPLADADNGVYISPSALVPEIREHGLEVVEIEMLPGAQLGAGESHHEVTFGNVAVKTGDELSMVPVAIKSFSTESERAGNEHDQLLKAKELGFATFEPLALARDGDVTYLITKKVDEIESRDNADWTISPSDTEAYEARVVPELAFIADSMAQLHAKGVYHGDASAKNFAKSDTGEMFVIDLEDAVIVEGDDAIAEAINGIYDPSDSRSMTDVWHAWYELIHPTKENQSNLFLEGEDFETCMAVFERDYLGPYLASLEKHASPDVLGKVDISTLRTMIIEKVARTT